MLYLLSERQTTTGARFVKTTVDGVFGMIVFPDDWDTTLFHFDGINNPNEIYTNSGVDIADWTDTFEANGAVFLPAAGIRDGVRMAVVGWYGFYWTASHLDSTNALGMYCTYDTVYYNCITYRLAGRSVRLVRGK